MASVAAIIDFLEGLAPLALASAWDNVGLLLGDRDAPVRRIMTCLTVTPCTAAEAVQDKVQLIVTHHPVLFRGVKRLTAGTSEGRMLSQLIQAGVAVFCPHTAFDNAPGGINDLLAAQLSLGDVKPLRPGTGPGSCKLVVFVPEQDLDRVADALFAAGAGHIGQYSQCSFRLVGTGTFFGSELTHPTVGQKGKREEVNEWRLEVVCPGKRLGPVVAALRQAHSYEEPAFDVYPLRPVLPSGGEGRIGRLPQPVSLGDLARTVKSRLKAVQALVVGDLDRMVQRVAIVCGAGGEFLGDALRSGADVLLTGEMRFHDCLTAQAEGVALLLAGHYVSERLGVEDLAVRLQDQWPDLEVWASRQERDPVTWN